jgi:hypothetical protein
MATARAGTEVEAANLALSDLGRPGIASLDDNSTRARACRMNFAASRDAILAQHNWGFATGWDSPAEITPPAAGWKGKFKKRFALPSDCLKVRSVTDSGANEWEVISDAADPAGSDAEVKVLATNLGAPEVCYTRLIATVRLWSPQFLKAFRHELASAIAPTLTGSTAKADSETAKAASAVSDAALDDGKEKSRRDAPRTTSWLNSRRLGGSRGRY